MKELQIRPRLFFVFFVFLSLAVQGNAQEVIDISHGGKKDLENYMAVFNTTGKTIAHSDIISGKYDTAFSSYDDYNISNGASEQWLLLKIKNNSSLPQTYYIGTTLFDHIEFYFPSDTGSWTIQKGGIYFPIKEKKFEHGHFSFGNLTVPANSVTTSYIKVVNTKSPEFQFISLKPTLFSAQDYHFEYGNLRNYNLVFLGIVLIMALYNFILLFITRERAYLYYVGYNLFVLVYALVLNGEVVQRFFSDASQQQKLVLFSGIGSFVFYVFFAKKMLELKQFYPKWNKILTGIGITTALMAIPTAMDLLVIATPVCFFTSITGYLLIFTATIMLARKKHVPAMYFLAASFFYLTSQLIAISQMLSLLPSSFFGLHAPLIVQLGIASELALLSLGLGARIISIREKTLKESQLKLTQYLEAVPVGIFVLDKNGHPFYANHTAHQLLGKGIIPSADKKEIAEIYHSYKAGTDEVYPSEEMPVIKALSGKSVTVEDMELRGADGKTISLEVSGRPIYDENNKIIYGIAAFQDITQRLASKKQLEEYSQTLEQKVIERTEEISQQKNAIEKEKQKSDALLLNILPEETAEELKTKGSSKPRRYEKVTVMFTDFVNFSMMSEAISPDELIDEINFYFSAFDAIISKYNLEKIKTIGDSYMCAGGLPAENATHPSDMTKAALEIQQFIFETRAKRIKEGKRYFDCRIGIHTGPLVAGIAGIKKFAYDIWGDTVNIASRMESSGEVGKVNISGATYELIKNEFTCVYRGKIDAKNKGAIDMYFVKEATMEIPYQEIYSHIVEKLKKDLPPALTYHSLGHVLDVLEQGEQIALAEGTLSKEELLLLKIACLYHDVGFLFIYRGHEESGCEIARKELPGFGLSEKQVDTVCGMIMATKIPQSPKNKLEEIICDADLDYLGRDDFFPIAKDLFNEVMHYGFVSTETEWNRIQESFLQQHHYFTKTNQQRRNSKKEEHLVVIRKLLGPSSVQ